MRRKIDYWLKGLLASIGTLMLSTPALAGEPHGTHQPHGSSESSTAAVPAGVHVHGQARLFIVQDDRALLIELLSPAANLLGFEHTPQTAQQWQQVARLRQRLQEDAQLITPLAGQCQRLSAQINLPPALDASRQRVETQPAAVSHSDIEVSYRYHCERPAALKTIDVALFDAFPALERLEVQWLTAAGSGVQALSAAQPRITIQ